MTLIVVTGGRAFDRPDVVDAVLDAFHAKHPVTLLLHGGATGADTHAGLWAANRGVVVEQHAAAWGAHGRAAGILRNRTMIEAAKLRGCRGVIAFPGGRGTAHAATPGSAGGRSGRWGDLGSDQPGE